MGNTINTEIKTLIFLPWLYDVKRERGKSSYVKTAKHLGYPFRRLQRCMASNSTQPNVCIIKTKEHMEIKYEILTSPAVDADLFYVYKMVYIKGEIKSSHRIYESKDMTSCRNMITELERSLK